MAKRSDVPEELFCSIQKHDPFKISKEYQIKYWWHAFSDLCQDEDDFQEFQDAVSDEDCWEQVNAHQIILDGRKVGKRLTQEPQQNFLKKYIIACRCCLRKRIISLKSATKKYGSIEILQSDLADFMTKNCIQVDKLVEFWLYYTEGREDEILNEANLHIFHLGLKYAMEMKQLWALKYFWRKIEELPESKMSSNAKDNIIMEYAEDAIRMSDNRPEIFDFFFSKLDPNRKLQFAREETVLALLKTLSFKEVEILFNNLQPSEVTASSYCSWLQLFQMQNLSMYVMCAVVPVFKKMWEKEGFDNHRSKVHEELISNLEYQDNILVPLMTKGHKAVVWEILDKANPETLERYMNSDNARIFNSLLNRKYPFVVKKFMSYKRSG